MIASDTAPSTRKPVSGEALKILTAWHGVQRREHARGSAIWTNPSTPITANHTSITGPKKLADSLGAALLKDEQRHQHRQS